MNNKDFFSNLDFKYPEIAICLQKNKNKFYVPIVMGLVDNAGIAPKEIKKKINPKKIRNTNNNLEIKDIKKTNYITLDVPEYLWNTDYKSTGIKYNKGDQFIIVFVGGDLNNIKIIGRC